MELYENIVMEYLTKDLDVFLSPQYSIRKGRQEWSCPDFVALNFRDKRVMIVEVSTASNPTSLRDKVEKRDSQWIIPLRDQLTSHKIIDQNWTFEVRVFIRKDAVHQFPYDDKSNVKVNAIEELGSPWDWTRSY